eukprot:COSAG02_NODE_42968_length_379_cov_0.935714_2_plen_72_part_01
MPWGLVGRGAVDERRSDCVEEMFALEDRLVDFIKYCSVVTVAPRELGAAADSVRQLVGMCERISKDGMFARQ